MTEPSEDDDIVDPLAELDQVIAGMRTLGNLIFGYYKAMREAGFDEDQAMGLALNYATLIYEQQEKNDTDD